MSRKHPVYSLVCALQEIFALTLLVEGKCAYKGFIKALLFMQRKHSERQAPFTRKANPLRKTAAVRTLGGSLCLNVTIAEKSSMSSHEAKCTLKSTLLYFVAITYKYYFVLVIVKYYSNVF